MLVAQAKNLYFNSLTAKLQRKPLHGATVSVAFVLNPQLAGHVLPATQCCSACGHTGTVPRAQPGQDAEDISKAYVRHAAVLCCK